MKPRIVYICPTARICLIVRPDGDKHVTANLRSFLQRHTWPNFPPGRELKNGTNKNNPRFHFSFFFICSGPPCVVWFRQHWQDSCLDEAWTAAGGPGVCDRSPTADLSERDSLNWKLKRIWKGLKIPKQQIKVKRFLEKKHRPPISKDKFKWSTTFLSSDTHLFRHLQNKRFSTPRDFQK